MIITWLPGKVRIRGPKFTQEISGYRCSHCNTFESSPRRCCPGCHGTYKGKIVPGRDDVKITEKKDEQT